MSELCRAHQRRSEGYGACADEKQVKEPGSLTLRLGHNCPQCGQFRAMRRAFQNERK